jgi:hypothetical protein
VNQSRHQVFVIERHAHAGSPGPRPAAALSVLVPQAARILLGRDGAAVSPWDVADPADVAPAKVAHLLRLHALLVGEHVHGLRPHGLGALERALLELAIRDVYARAADGEGTPSESLLRAVLIDLVRQERSDPAGSAQHAGTYADLALRIAELCAGGPYADVLDRPTTAGAHDAPFVIFDLTHVPERTVAAVVLSIAEFVAARARQAPAGSVALLAELLELASPVDEDAPLPPAFARESLLNGLHDSYMRRRVRSGEARPIAYLHAISDVAHFLHPPTALSPGRRAHEVPINPTTQGERP